jgi:vitamin B12 transporter
MQRRIYKVRSTKYKVRFFLVMLCLFLEQSVFCVLTAQNDSLQKLQEVRLSVFPLREYAIGTKHLPLDSLVCRQATGQTLAQVLMEQTGIYLKQYGASGIASVSFRGTGAGHTAVLWNGLPINSFTLGETDFNSLSIASAKNVIVSAGAGSSLYGTGSVGGTIQLLSALPDSAGQKIALQLFAGSFGNVGGQLAYQLRKKRWAIHQNIFAQKAQNDFAFINIAKFEKPLERQQNAENSFQGLQTDIYFLPNVQNTFAIHSWWQDRQNNISPTMGANLQPQSYAKSQQCDVRLLATWKHFLATQEGEFECKVGYLQNMYVYDVQDSTQTQTFVAIAQYKAKLRQNLHFRALSSHTFVTALVENYTETKKESRQEIGAGLHWQPLSRLWLALNVRQMWVEAKNVPFTPSLGIEYQASKTWRIKGYVGRTYRVPTLNDRFWAIGGNPFLRAENGITSEIGIKFSPTYHKWQVSIELTPYLLWVRDWILWTPIGNVWSPQNLRAVQARGVEVQESILYKAGKVQLNQGLAYSFTQSQTEGKQLAYTPFHRANVWGQASYKNFFLYQNVSFTGKRYGSLTNTDFMPAFLLLNASIGKTFAYRKQKIVIQLRMNNVLNTAYQNYENRAMPRRNVMLSCLLDL